MDVKVDINEVAINEAVTAAVINSAIGKQIEESIKQKMKDWDGQRIVKEAVEACIKSTIRDLVYTTIKEQYAADIKIWIASACTEKFTHEMFNKMWERFGRDY